MKILGIDTSSKYCNVAIIEEKDIMIEYTINGFIKKHSSILIPAIQEIFNKIDLKIGDIDGVAVTIGPGSFTGLRIGLGSAKGLSYAAGIPITGIHTLDVLAYNAARLPVMLCPILDARKNEVYFALFHGGNHLKKIIDYQCNSIDNLLDRLKNIQENIIFLGEGILKYQKRIEDMLGPRAIILYPTLSTIKASNVAFLGLEKIRNGQVDNAFSISPFYLRKSEAEISWEKRHKI